jgi:hypothetical protein
MSKRMSMEEKFAISPKEQGFLRGENVPERLARDIKPDSKQASKPASYREGKKQRAVVSVYFRWPEPLVERLKECAYRRKEKGDSPSTMQDIAIIALEEWLEKNPY